MILNIKRMGIYVVSAFMLFTALTKINASDLELEQSQASFTKSVVIENNNSENHEIGTTPAYSNYLKKGADFAFSCGKTLVTAPWKLLNYAYNHPKQVLALGVIALTGSALNPIGTYAASRSGTSGGMQVVSLNNFSNSSLTPYYKDSYFYRNDSNFCYDNDGFDDSEDATYSSGSAFLEKYVKAIKGWKQPSEESKQWAEKRTKLIKTPSQSALHNVFDLRNLLQAGQLPVYDQGNLGSCTANAAAGAMWFDECRPDKETNIVIDKKCTDQNDGPSRLMIYFNTRALSGNFYQDSGSSITDTVKSLLQSGSCREKIWPYNTDLFTQMPPRRCYYNAVIAIDDYLNDDDLHSHMRVEQNVETIKRVITQGYPVIFGTLIYNSFNCDNGMIPMPEEFDNIIGGHALLLVGYDDTKQAFILRNSWGTDWGDDGYCQIPYQYVTDPDLSDDFWVIRSVRQK